MWRMWRTYAAVSSIKPDAHRTKMRHAQIKALLPVPLPISTVAVQDVRTSQNPFLGTLSYSSEGRLTCPILANRLVTRGCCRQGIHTSFPCSYSLLLPMAPPDANGAAVYIVADNQRHISTIFLMFQQCSRGYQQANANRGGSLTAPPLKLCGQQNSAAIGRSHEESLDCGGENV
jgi:hypothetical protein